MEINIPSYAIPDFLEIVHNYGAFLERRDSLKKQDNPHPTSIAELISKQKYYKKLKHEFNSKYPDIKDEFKTLLLSHQSNIENKKRVDHNKMQAILALSPRLISYFDYVFGDIYNERIIYSKFVKDIKAKYSIEMDTKDIEHLNEEYKQYKIRLNRKQKNINLSLKYINIIVKSLKLFCESVSEDDFKDIYKYTHSDSKKSDVEKIQVTDKIIREHTDRFKRLYSDYLEISN